MTGTNGKFFPLHLFIFRIDNQTPQVGQWGFNTCDEKGLLPGLRTQSPPEIPTSQSTLKLNYLEISHERSSSQLSGVQDVDAGEGNKGTIQ
jgi:hypothetical protein